MIAAVFLWTGLAILVGAVWLVAGATVGAAALGVYGLLVAATGAAAMWPSRDRTSS